LLMWATTSLKTPMCLRVSSGDAGLPSTLPITSKRVRHVDALTTRNLVRLLIGVKTPEAYSHYTATALFFGRAPPRFGSIGSFPRHPLPQVHDVRSVVFAVPGVGGKGGVQAHGAVFRVQILPREIGLRKAMQQRHPTHMQ